MRYEQELVETRKQNAALADQLKALNKTHEEGLKLYNAQLLKAQEKNTELQKRPNWFIVILFSTISAAIAIWIFTQTHVIL